MIYLLLMQLQLFNNGKYQEDIVRVDYHVDVMIVNVLTDLIFRNGYE